MIRLIYTLATVSAFGNGIAHAAMRQDAQAIASFGAGAALTLIATVYYAYKECK